MKVLFLVFWWWIPPDRPDIDHAFNAFVCQGSMCRDKASITDVALWRKFRT